MPTNRRGIQNGKCVNLVAFLLIFLSSLQQQKYQQQKLFCLFNSNMTFLVINKKDVFLMIRRKKTTIFLDAKENTTVVEIKKMIHGITKVEPERLKLFYKDDELDDNRILSDYNLTVNTAKAQSPATIGLAFDDDDGLEIIPFSTPPDLPEGKIVLLDILF